MGRRRTVRAAEPSRFQPRVPRLRGARVSVSVPRGGRAAYQVIFLPGLTLG